MSINNFIVDKNHVGWGITEDFKPIYVKYGSSVENRIDILWPTSAQNRQDNIMTWFGSSRKLYFNWRYIGGDRPTNFGPVINRTFQQLGFPGYVDVRNSSIIYWPTTEKSDCITLGMWRDTMPNIISLDDMLKLAGTSVKPKITATDVNRDGSRNQHLVENYNPTPEEEIAYEAQRSMLDNIRYYYDKYVSATHRGDIVSANNLRDEAMIMGLQSLYDNLRSKHHINDELTYNLLKFYKEVKPEGWNPILERKMAKQSA